MSFLPDDYKVPSIGTKYLKLETGKNTLRVLSSPVIGWEYWTEEGDKKAPIRVKKLKDVPSERIHSNDPNERPKHFWAMFVWGREAETIQILEVTQATIQAGIKALVDEKDWGNPKDYDISINRAGEGMDTKYTVTPKPKKVLEKEIKDIWKECKEIYNLEKLYTGENPFGDDEIKTSFDD